MDQFVDQFVDGSKATSGTEDGSTTKKGLYPRLIVSKELVNQVSIQRCQAVRQPRKAHKFISLLTTLLGLLAFFSALGAAAWSEPDTDTMAKAKAKAKAKAGSLRFNVWLDDRKMGKHSYSFAPENGDLIVTSTADFSVKILFVEVFSYQHTSVETWRSNCLMALTSSTTTNGNKESAVLSFPETDCAGTFAYWDLKRLRKPVLTNAQNGKQEETVFQELNESQLPIIGKRKTLSGYNGKVTEVILSTPSATFGLFYDDSLNLLVMQTQNDGRTISYISDVLKVK